MTDTTKRYEVTITAPEGRTAFTPRGLHTLLERSVLGISRVGGAAKIEVAEIDPAEIKLTDGEWQTICNSLLLLGSALAGDIQGMARCISYGRGVFERTGVNPWEVSDHIITAHGE